MYTSHDALYLGLSLVIAVLAAYSALELSSRVETSRDPIARFIWLVGGALSLAAGIWSMHFISRLMLEVPFEMTFTTPSTFLSGVFAMFTSGLALKALTAERSRLHRALPAGLWLTLSILGMHFIGAGALAVTPAPTYCPYWVGTGVLAALVLSQLATFISTCAPARMSTHAVRTATAITIGLAVAAATLSEAFAMRLDPLASSASASGMSKEALLSVIALTAIATLLGALVMNHISARLVRHEQESNRLQRLNLELSLKAHTDSLTGLPNRESLELHIKRVLEEANRKEQTFWVLFLDLDGFKAVNDTHGHFTGDELLKEVATRLNKAIRHSDKAFRVSGDEFVVVTSASDSDEKVEKALAERVLSSVREPYALAGVDARVTVSIGLARYPDNGDDMRSLLLSADASMYAAKKSGKNRVSMGGESVSISRSRPELMHELEDALHNNALDLVFQPIVGAQNRSVHGVEALMRWSHPSLGVLTAAQFLPQAEAYGLSTELAEWALERAMWQLSTRPLAAPLWVNINLTASQVQDPRLPERIESLMNRYGLSSRQLGVEVTETMMMQDFATSTRVLRALQELGLSTTMDDFGTGLSSLTQLHRLPLDVLKVDKTFIESMQHDVGAMRVVEAILAMSKALGLRTIAEGIGSSAQFESTRLLGADLMQGHGISRPLDWASLDGFSETWAQGKRFG